MPVYEYALVFGVIRLVEGNRNDDGGGNKIRHHRFWNTGTALHSHHVLS